MQKSLVMTAGWVQFSICRARDAGAQAQGHPHTALAPGARATTLTATQASQALVWPHTQAGDGLCCPRADACQDSLDPASWGWWPAAVQGTPRAQTQASLSGLSCLTNQVTLHETSVRLHPRVRSNMPQITSRRWTCCLKQRARCSPDGSWGLGWTGHCWHFSAQRAIMREAVTQGQLE